MPRLPPEMLNLLELSLLEDEVSTAIKNLASGKAPGPDGYTAKYYKTFQNILITPLTNYANFAWRISGLKSPLQIHTSLPSPNLVDPSCCGSYRPISPLNIDAKVFMNHLHLLLSKWVFRDQTGFIPGREAKDNSLRTPMRTALTRHCSQSTLLLSTDAANAFESLNWTYLLVVLFHIGFFTRMLARVAALYRQPTAQIRVNGLFSDSFTLHNSTQQGCPLPIPPFFCPFP